MTLVDYTYSLLTVSKQSTNIFNYFICYKIPMHGKQRPGSKERFLTFLACLISFANYKAGDFQVARHFYDKKIYKIGEKFTFFYLSNCISFSSTTIIFIPWNATEVRLWYEIQYWITCFACVLHGGFVRWFDIKALQCEILALLRNQCFFIWDVDRWLVSAPTFRIHQCPSAWPMDAFMRLQNQKSEQSHFSYLWLNNGGT